MNKLIILDRDGVINLDRVDYVKSLDEWEFIPGSLQAIVELSQANYTIMIATNQSGISKHIYSEETLESIHRYLIQQVENAGGKIDGIYYCPHHDIDNCDCRKPKTGLLDAIERDTQQNLSNVVFVGDALRDVQAARSKGCKPVLVLSGKGETTQTQLKALGLLNEVDVYDNLLSYTYEILNDI